MNRGPTDGRLGRQGDGLRQLRELRGSRGATAPPWVAVAGAKGGVGKTLLAVNLALQLARAGQRTLLVDFDPGCGNVDVHLRLSPRRTLEDVLAGRCPPAAALVDGPGGLRVLAGRSGSSRLAARLADDAARPGVLAAVGDAAAGLDVVVCDTGAGIGPAVLAVAGRAELVLGATTPEPSALTDTYALCKVLHRRGRPLPRLVVNRVRSRDEAMRTAGRLATVCARFLAAPCELLGWVRDDPELERSVFEQRPFALHGHGEALADLRALAAATRSALPPLPRRQGRPPAEIALPAAPTGPPRPA